MFRKLLIVTMLVLVPVPAQAAVYWAAPEASGSAATILIAASTVKETLPADSLTISPPSDLGGGLPSVSGAGLANAAQWAMIFAGLAVAIFALSRRHRLRDGLVMA